MLTSVAGSSVFPRFLKTRCRQIGLLVILGWLSVLMVVPDAHAVPSWGDEFTVEQPDGTKAQVRVWGDEFYRVVESPSGYTLVRDTETGEICYAVVSVDIRNFHKGCGGNCSDSNGQWRVDGDPGARATAGVNSKAILPASGVDRSSSTSGNAAR